MAALSAAGAGQIFPEVASGAKTDRSQLRRAPAFALISPGMPMPLSRPSVPLDSCELGMSYPQRARGEKRWRTAAPIGHRSCPVGKSDASCGGKQCELRDYPVGDDNQELLVIGYYFQIVLSLYPHTAFCLTAETVDDIQEEDLLKKRSYEGRRRSPRGPPTCSCAWTRTSAADGAGETAPSGGHCR